MGYPMTYQRVMNRNGLTEGGYLGAPLRWKANVNLEPPDEFMPQIWPHMADRVRAYEGAIKNLLGDLRRLEEDTKDENAVCKRIAHATGIDPEVVAAVLKEFIDT